MERTFLRSSWLAVAIAATLGACQSGDTSGAAPVSCELGEVQFANGCFASDDLTVPGPEASASGGAGNACREICEPGGTTWAASVEVAALRADALADSTATLALSQDGRTLALGAPSVGAGVVVVFARNDGAWALEGELEAPGAQADEAFGTSVSLSGDGSRLVIGAPAPTGGGGAYVFDRADGAWSTGERLGAPTGPANGGFGSQVVVSGDGTTVAVGAPTTEGVHVFTTSGRGWGTGGRLSPPLGIPSGGRFGEALAISDDARRLVVGRSREANDVGAAYVYLRDQDVWERAQDVRAPAPSPGSRFGAALALSGDGTTLVVSGGGASFDPGVGAPGIEVYRAVGRAYEPSGTVTPEGGAPAPIAPHLSLSRSGNHLALSIAGESIQILSSQGDAWVVEGRLDQARADANGAFAALSGNGDLLAMGADGGARVFSGGGGDACTTVCDGAGGSPSSSGGSAGTAAGGRAGGFPGGSAGQPFGGSGGADRGGAGGGPGGGFGGVANGGAGGQPGCLCVPGAPPICCSGVNGGAGGQPGCTGSVYTPAFWAGCDAQRWEVTFAERDGLPNPCFLDTVFEFHIDGTATYFDGCGEATEVPWSVSVGELDFNGYLHQIRMVGSEVEWTIGTFVFRTRRQ